jgi:hypothetical protein
MLRGASDDARRLAAGFLGGLAADDPCVAEGIAAALVFDPCAARVPWHGGALFLPALECPASRRARWPATSCAGCCGPSDPVTPPRAQLHNNLRSLELARAAGYHSPGWREASTDAWLTIRGYAVGKEALAELLAEQGVAEQERYRAVLATVR